MVRDHVPWNRWQLTWRVSITLLVSIVIPLVTGLAEGRNGQPLLSAFEQFLLGGLVFLAVTLTGVAYDLNELRQADRREHEMWEVRQSVDTMIYNTRVSFDRILERHPPEENLFAQYFERVLSSVADDVHQAATKGELRVDELTFGTTDLLLKIMEIRGRDTLRLVHSLDARPNNFDFSTWARSYYYALTRLAKAQKITVKRLFLYSEPEDLTTPIAQNLFAFHANAEGHDFRVISRGDWTSIVRGLKQPQAHAEFGVWGDLLAYSAIRSSAVHMEGSYTSQPRDIERFREVFDAGWRLGFTPTFAAGQVTVDKLFSTGLPAPPVEVPAQVVGITGKDRTA